MIIILKIILNNVSPLKSPFKIWETRVNLIDNKSTATNILINNVKEKSTENAIHLITKVNQIMQDVDNTIHVTHAYRIGQTNNKSKPWPIIACLETEKQKYAAVKQAYRLKRSTKFQNAFVSGDLCHYFKISRQEQLSKFKEMKQQYRSVWFRGTEPIKKKKQSGIKSHTTDLSTTVAKPAQSTVPVINKHQPQDSNRQLPHPPQSSSALPVTWPAQSSVPMNKRPSKQYYRQLTPRATCPSGSSADTNLASKCSHHIALQPPPPSLATSSQVVDMPCSSASNCATLGTVPSNVAPLTLRRSSRLLIKNMKYQ